MMNQDEQEFAILALSLQDSSYIPYSPRATGHATLYFYMILASFNTFGDNTFSLRLPAAVFGVAGVLLFYFVMREVFTYKKAHLIIPALTAFLLITSRWYLNFSRFAFEATLLIVLELLSTLFIFKYRKSKQLWHVVASGIFAGLAYNSYTPGRIFFLLPLLMILVQLPVNKLKWSTFKPAILFLISFGIMILPISIYLSQNQDTRIYQQFFITNEQLTIWTRVQWFFQNILNNFVNLFFLKGDVNGIHNYPYKSALNPLIGFFFIFGLLLSIKHWKDNFSLFFIGYFVLSIVPTLFTYPWENPNMLRTVTVIPSVIFFVGKAFVFIFKRFNYNKWVVLFIFLLLIGSAVYELRTYFIFQKEVFKTVFTNSIRFSDYRNLYGGKL